MADFTAPLNEQGQHDINCNIPPAPIYALKIIFFGRSHGSFDPPAAFESIQFSVRDMPNPPSRLRKTHTGLSARLRTEVLASKEAQARLQHMISQTSNMMLHMEREQEQENAEDTSSAAPAHHPGGGLDPPLLVVAITCEEGKHRSVSFAEELSTHVKRKGWEISVKHRDLPKDSSTISETGGTVNDKHGIKTRMTKKQRDQERRQGKSARKGFLAADD